MVSQKENKTSSVQQLIANSRNHKTKKIVEKAMPALLFSAALISILTTFGIVFTLIFETFEFLNVFRLRIFYLVHSGYRFLERSRYLGFYRLSQEH